MKNNYIVLPQRKNSFVQNFSPVILQRDFFNFFAIKYYKKRLPVGQPYFYKEVVFF